jgi:hypothetical protein
MTCAAHDPAGRPDEPSRIAAAHLFSCRLARFGDAVLHLGVVFNGDTAIVSFML